MLNSNQKILFCALILSRFGLAGYLNVTNVTDPVANQALIQLISNETLTQTEQEQLESQGLRALTSYMAPQIKSMPDYTGRFLANCSIFINTYIEEIECNVTPVSMAVSAGGYPLGEGMRLPLKYAFQITRSNVLLVNILADWTGRTTVWSEQYTLGLFGRVNTCTQTASISDAIPTPTGLPSLSHSLVPSKTPQLSFTETFSNSLSSSNSPTSAETASKSQTRLSGLLAAWNQTGGTYADATTQGSRYNATATTVTDALTGLQWELVPSASTMTWAQAVAYCTTEATGGFHDWRLPNNAELESLVDYTINYVGATPGINAVFSGTPTNYFYSSTPLVGSPTQQPWWMSFGQTACYSGLLYSLQYSPGCTPAVAGQGYARCVRSSYKPLPAVRYTTTSDTVTDTITGLIWQRVSTGSTMTQANAVTHCSGLSLPSFSSGWRLPTVKELATLVDYSVPYGHLMMDATVFAGEPTSWFWSSTPVAGRPTHAWFVGFAFGDLNGYGVTDSYYVRCVR